VKKKAAFCGYNDSTNIRYYSLINRGSFSLERQEEIILLKLLVRDNTLDFESKYFHKEIIRGLGSLFFGVAEEIVVRRG
jgi:hypothetical protein